MDDISSVFNNSFEAKKFFNYINTRHPNIKFTMETEVNKIIPFLDVLIDNSQALMMMSPKLKKFSKAILILLLF